MLGSVLVNEFPQRQILDLTNVISLNCCVVTVSIKRFILINSPLLGYATIEEAVFSMSSAPSNSRKAVLRNPFLSIGTVNCKL
jgi:hypothetical protein